METREERGGVPRGDSFGVDPLVRSMGSMRYRRCRVEYIRRYIIFGKIVGFGKFSKLSSDLFFGKKERKKEI